MSSAAGPPPTELKDRRKEIQRFLGSWTGVWKHFWTIEMPEMSFWDSFRCFWLSHGLSLGALGGFWGLLGVSLQMHCACKFLQMLPSDARVDPPIECFCCYVRFVMSLFAGIQQCKAWQAYAWFEGRSRQQHSERRRQQCKYKQ